MTTPLMRVYHSLNKVNAYKIDDNSYALRGETYHIKEKIKEHGGRWDGEKKRWVVSRECVDAIGALRRVRVQVAAHCHEEEQTISVTHPEAESGIVRLGCGLCDCSFRCGDDVKILEIIEL